MKKPVQKKTEKTSGRWFKSGNSWALRFPRPFRLPGDGVIIRRDAGGARLIIEAEGSGWDDFFAPGAARVTSDFNPARDDRPPQARDLF